MAFRPLGGAPDRLGCEAGGTGGMPTAEPRGGTPDGPSRPSGPTEARLQLQGARSNHGQSQGERERGGEEGDKGRTLAQSRCKR